MPGPTSSFLSNLLIFSFIVSSNSTMDHSKISQQVSHSFFCCVDCLWVTVTFVRYVRSVLPALLSYRTMTNPAAISLYRSLTRQAKQLSDYNFRSYAVRRVKAGFLKNRQLQGYATGVSLFKKRKCCDHVAHLVSLLVRSFLHAPKSKKIASPCLTPHTTTTNNKYI